jgi:Leucine-rich repeat (LRR) protein
VVSNLPALKRVCLEECNLQELNLSGNPALEDVRAAINVFTNVVLEGGTGPNIWHWCTRNNPNILQNFQDVMTNFYSLRELWIWDDNQSGALTVVSTNLMDVKANDNYFTSADFTGQANLQSCWLFNNSLSNLVVSGCVGLRELDAHNNQLGTAALDALLTELAGLAVSSSNLQSVDLTGNPGPPSLVGMTAYSVLTNRSVVVHLDPP